MLVAVFVGLGVLVYQFTAPPPPPGSEGFSVGSLIRNMRRGVQGPRDAATADSAQTVTVPAAIGLLRVNISRTSDLTITGEDRQDVAATLHVSARGFDQAEAAASAHGPKLKVETSGDAIVVTVDTAGAPLVSRTQPPPTLSIVLSVPRRLALRADSHIGRFVLLRVSSAEILK